MTKKASTSVVPIIDTTLRDGEQAPGVAFTLKEKLALVSVGAQDAFRADPDFLRTFVRAAAAKGAHHVRIADTVGLARPSQVVYLVRSLTAAAGASDLEFHGHNDLGMATANTVAAIEAGIPAVSVTVNGVGERAGNAALEQVAVAVGTLDDRCCRIDTRQLMKLCRFVSRITRRPIPLDRPVTGGAVFSHESGIHGAAVLKDPGTYQPFSPQLVGREAGQLVVGRHSGSQVIRHVLQTAGITLDAEKAERLLAVVRTRSLQQKARLSSGELVQLYRQALP